MQVPVLLLASTLALGSVAGAESHAADIARGDDLWARRAEGHDGPRAGREPVASSADAYRKAVREAPDDLEARWKLLRSLYFLGYFASEKEAQKLRAYDEARAVAEAGIERLRSRVGSDDLLEQHDPEELPGLLARAGIPEQDVARLYFWAAIDLGAWARVHGLFDAVRVGAANRIHDYARVTVALEPSYLEGGAYRLLARLHAELPSVPWISGWVDRSKALPLAERALDVKPEDPGNRLLLALTLLDLYPERRGEAVPVLRDVAELEPRSGSRVEDLAVREAARDRLAEEGLRTAASGPGPAG